MFDDRKKKVGTGSIRANVLNPKQAGLTGKNKPGVLVVGSPYDERARSTGLETAVTLTEDRGYISLNKQGVEYYYPSLKSVKNNNDDVRFQKKIKPFQSRNRNLIIWLEAHGAPGYLFGSQSSWRDEKENLKLFADYILAIENETNMKVTNVILNSCYSASECITNNNTDYFNSSARLLSILLPDVNVIGFVGINDSAGIHDVYKLKDDRQLDRHEKESYYHNVDPQELTKCRANLVDGAIVFKNGEATEFTEKNLFFDHRYTKKFVADGCGSRSQDRELRSLAGPAREEINRLRAQDETNNERTFGDRQFEEVQALAPDNRPRVANR